MCALGLVLVIEGLPYFAFPAGIKSMLARIHETPDSTLRIVGLVSIVAGLVLVFFGTR